MTVFYGMDGQPLDRDGLAALYEDHSAREVGRDERDGVMVSTVLLGIDHNFGQAGPPLIFETMIFGGAHDEYQERYATREQAEEGHRRAYALAFDFDAAAGVSPETEPAAAKEAP